MDAHFNNDDDDYDVSHSLIDPELVREAEVIGNAYNISIM
jgi:hypothetical protein